MPRGKRQGHPNVPVLRPRGVHGLSYVASETQPRLFPIFDNSQAGFRIGLFLIIPFGVSEAKNDE